MASWQEVRPAKKIEGLVGRLRPVERPVEETNLILQSAFEYAGQDVAAAQLLLRKTCFFLYGATWGESLFVADSGGSLIETAAVLTAIEKVSRTPEATWNQVLANGAGRGVMNHPYDLPLYGLMLLDLGGQKAFDLFNNTVAKPREIPLVQAMKSLKAKEIYERIKGKSFWEMPEAMIIPVLLTSYSYWKGMMEGNCPELEDLPDGDHTHELPDYMVEILTSVRDRLRVLAKVVVGKGFLKKDQRVGDRDGLNLGLEELYELID